MQFGKSNPSMKGGRTYAGWNRSRLLADSLRQQLGNLDSVKGRTFP